MKKTVICWFSDESRRGLWGAGHPLFSSKQIRLSMLIIFVFCNMKIIKKRKQKNRLYSLFTPCLKSLDPPLGIVEGLTNHNPGHCRRWLLEVLCFNFDEIGDHPVKTQNKHLLASLRSKIVPACLLIV